MPLTADARSKGWVHVLVALVGATILAAMGAWITAELSLAYIVRHPQGNAMEGLGAAFNAIVVGLFVEVLAGVVIFKRLPK